MVRTMQTKIIKVDNNEIKYKTLSVNDLNVAMINVTERSFSFMNNNDIIRIDPSGFVVKTKIKEVSITSINNNTINLIKPLFERDDETAKMLIEIKKVLSKKVEVDLVLIIGDLMSAQAYPSLIVNPVPYKNTQVMRLDKFIVY